MGHNAFEGDCFEMRQQGFFNPGGIDLVGNTKNEHKLTAVFMPKIMYIRS